MANRDSDRDRLRDTQTDAETRTDSCKPSKCSGKQRTQIQPQKQQTGLRKTDKHAYTATG